VRGVMKYLVQWKEFMAEHDIWKKEEDLENAKKVIAEFKKRIDTKVKRQKRLDMIDKRDFRRGSCQENI